MTESAADQATTDPRPMFERAVSQAERVVTGVGTGQLDDPTPCQEFDVRALLGHLITVLRRIDTVARDGDPFLVPDVTTGVPDERWLEEFRDARRRIADSWADDTVLDKMLTVPFGTFPGRAVLDGYTMELAGHTWDLAKATGSTVELDSELGSAALSLARAMVPAEPRGGDMPFGPVVDVPEDADPYAQLAGWLGRRP